MTGGRAAMATANISSAFSGMQIEICHGPQRR
jgi:hypothetical protein